MLALGGLGTMRPQLVVWNPAMPAEACEAAARIAELKEQGFVEVDGSSVPGETRLVPPQRDANFGLLRVLSDNGDDRVIWDRRDPMQVREAFARFQSFIKRGYTAYVSMGDGQRGHRIHEFDPGLEEVILVPSGVLVPG